DLRKVLPSYFMQNHIPKRDMRTDFDRNMVSMTESRNNFNNQNEFYQNGIRDCTYTVTRSQQQINFNNTSSEREMSPGFNKNPDSFYRNIRNNVMTTQADFTDNQNNINNSLAHQNGVGGYIHNFHPQQQVDFNNISPERETRTGYNSNIININSPYENTGNNIMTTQAALMTDIQNNCLHHQNGV